MVNMPRTVKKGRTLVRKETPVTSKPGSGPVEVLSMNVPIAYLRVLAEEAEFLGWNRGQLLATLVKIRRGELEMKRTATKMYDDIKPKELATVENYRWYVTPKTKADFLEELRSSGNPTQATLVMRLIEQWLG